MSWISTRKVRDIITGGHSVFLSKHILIGYVALTIGFARCLDFGYRGVETWKQCWAVRGKVCRVRALLNNAIVTLSTKAFQRCINRAFSTPRTCPPFARIALGVSPVSPLCVYGE
eukprot:m.148597 g.148597  ORF g.148597 m.148597 type:complete len:115 (-) comp17801_c0_seq19:3209-3553(-)